MFVAVAVNISLYFAVPEIVTETVGVIFDADESVIPFPLALLYALVAATVAVHPIYFPTAFAFVILYVLAVAPLIVVPLVAVELSAYHH